MSAIPDPLRSLPRTYPSGTVAFAFTDIEGSTQRWERDRSAMQEAVRRHDALMRAAIEAHDGHVFKTIGDAFCAAFARPQDAVAAMLGAQQTLAAQDFSAVDGIQVRAAIHVGTADERDGDYFGPTVNRVARLLAIGHGGQLLVSGVAADLVSGLLPERATLHDLGSHRLKDLAQPEQVYQLLAPDLRAHFPPLRSLDALPNNLPRMPTYIHRSRNGDRRDHRSGRGASTGHAGRFGWLGQDAHGAAGCRQPARRFGRWGVVDRTGAAGRRRVHRADRRAGVGSQCIACQRPRCVFGSGAQVDAGAAGVRQLRACRRRGRADRGGSDARVSAAQVVGLESSGFGNRRGDGIPDAVAKHSGISPAGKLTAAEAGGFAAVALFCERARAVDQRFVLGDENAPMSWRRFAAVSMGFRWRSS